MRNGKELSLAEFYEMIRQTYMSNNHINTIRVEFDDGIEKAQLNYTSRKGFEQDQDKRRGILKLKL